MKNDDIKKLKMEKDCFFAKTFRQECSDSWLNRFLNKV